VPEITVLVYKAANGREPFRDWADSLDKTAAQAVAARINRLMSGNFGDWKAVGDGVYELRIQYGAGYRVYFGRDDRTMVILLNGGSKRSQAADIRQAIRNWRDYVQRK